MVETKTKLAEIQTAKKKKKETLMDQSEQVESVVARNKTTMRLWLKSLVKKLRG